MSEMVRLNNNISVNLKCLFFTIFKAFYLVKQIYDK